MWFWFLAVSKGFVIRLAIYMANWAESVVNLMFPTGCGQPFLYSAACGIGP